MSQPRPVGRADLLDAADRAVDRHGPGASMTVIAAEAGITKPILYRHFGDRSGLYAALAERHTDRLLDTLGAALAAGRDPRERLRLAVAAYLQVVAAEPQVYRLLVQADEGAPARPQVRSFLRRLGDLLARGLARETGDPPDSTRAAVWASAAVGSVQAAGEWWLEHPGCPREDVVEQLVELLWSGYGRATRAR